MAETTEYFTTVEDSMGNENMDWYDQDVMTKLDVLTAVKGTVLSSRQFWVDTFILVCIFAACVGSVYKFDMDTQEPAYNTLHAQLSGFTTFLLCFLFDSANSDYSAIMIDGINVLQGTLRKKVLIMNDLITTDEAVLKNVKRWTRAALEGIFLQNRGLSSMEVAEQLRADKLVTKDELVILAKSESASDEANCVNLPETIFAWEIVQLRKIVEVGQIDKGWIFHMYLKQVFMAMDAAGFIHSKLSAGAPFHYFHLLSLLVKTTVVICAAVCGFEAGGAMLDGHLFKFNVEVARFVIMTCLYQATLIACVEITNPFTADLADLPMTATQEGFGTDADAMIKAVQSLPSWTKKEFEGIYAE